MVFGEKREHTALVFYIIFDAIDNLRIVKGGCQHSFSVHDDGAVNDHISALDGLAEINGYALGVVKIEGHLEPVGFTASTEDQHGRDKREDCFTNKLFHIAILLKFTIITRKTIFYCIPLL